ncbi:hypothetical protein DT019_27040 [Streptomyces sp. SDr-06]|uniref:hypothetical protein n=1 Tax=Streptomyces sp. SDr-06 TaxID=2267702 RepID=UPI000E1AE277|nr:hypothetical protein [Streptomyces sp. SDr-06]RCH65459.1 hypothetical protein DT019_27040 [Streptomyces sp. SDr-06]
MNSNRTLVAPRRNIGDFDCSGEDIERDWGARTGCWRHTERVLLTYEQVRAYELPATEGKHGDPRWPAFARRYGFDPRRPVQWEVEALRPAELRHLVLAAVDPYIDRDVWSEGGRDGRDGRRGRGRGSGRAQPIARRPGPPRLAAVSPAAEDGTEVACASVRFSRPPSPIKGSGVGDFVAERQAYCHTLLLGGVLGRLG